jgi:hypothetical protein
VAEYTYLTCDLVTDTILDEVPLTVSSMSWALMEPGVMTGPSVPLYDREKVPNPAAVLAATIPGRTALYAYRDNRLLWGGIIWKRNYTQSSGRLNFMVSEFQSYWMRRLIPSLGVSMAPETLKYSQVDQFDIVLDLFERAMADMSGAVMITLPEGAASGVLRDRSYEASEFKPMMEAIVELAKVDNGFEFAIDVRDPAVDPEMPMMHRMHERVLRLGYPTIGQHGALTLEAPGNVQEYDWPEDAEELCTDMWARSEASEGATLVGHYEDTALLAAGWPRLERANTSYSEVRIQATIDGHAKADQEAAAGPVVAATFTVHADDPEAQIGSWNVGDWARVRISDHRFPPDPLTGAPGYDAELRVVGASLDPSADKLSVIVNPVLVVL